MGGIIGYHRAILGELIGEGLKSDDDGVIYRQPEGIDLSEDGMERREAVLSGIRNQGRMAELYPVGGSGDRLGLTHAKTGEPLPVARLRFEGRTLLSLLIRDLQAREYLHYKLHGKQVLTPIALMTSRAKSNDSHMKAIFEENDFFGRPKSSFKFFVQPSVPVLTNQGDWVMKEPLRIFKKPGGHGVIWKLAKDEGVFDWFKEAGRVQALVRQINNPLAGTDCGLLALIGKGSEEGRSFGFASCDRPLQGPEGMMVLKEQDIGDHFRYGISNIEYTDFAKKGLKERPAKPGSPYSQFPASTNILFTDLAAIEAVTDEHPVPGMLINMKSMATFVDAEGNEESLPAGRLECLMQNIADVFVDEMKEPLQEGQAKELKTFITFNDRQKTISSTKKSYHPGESINGTPDGAHFYLTQERTRFLRDDCGMDIAETDDVESYLSEGPAVLLKWHPGLGPLYSIMRQKIRQGRMARGSELSLELAELDLENLDLDGSLQIEARSPLGRWEKGQWLSYGDDAGKCELIDVRVENAGIDWSAENVYWKGKIQRKESLEIILHGNAEFVAKGVRFTGGQLIEVPAGLRRMAYEENGELKFRDEEISASTWHWAYSISDQKDIELKKVSA